MLRYSVLSKLTPKSVLLQSLGKTLLLANTLLVAQAVEVTWAPPSSGADFTHVKRVFVPPTRIRRHSASELREAMPYSSINPANGSALDSPGSAYSLSGTYGSVAIPYTPPPSSSKPGKNGLVPPPPPVTPSIVAPPSGLIAPSMESYRPETTSYRPSTHMAPPRSTHLSSAALRTKHHIDQLLQQGKINEAHDVIRNYFKAYPKDHTMRSELVSSLIAKSKEFSTEKDFDNAARAAREALALEPSSSSATASLNDALKKQGINAASHLEHVKLAHALAGQGRTSEALVEYRQSLKIKASAEGHVGVGDMLVRDGKKEQAKHEFQKALELEPNSAAALRSLGTVKYSLDDVVGANADLSRALIINPDDKAASRTLIDLWQRQVSKGPRDVNSHLGLARAYQLSGDLKSAQNEYKQVVRLDPENPNLPAARHSFKLALARQEARKAHLAAQTLEATGAIKEAHQKILEACALAPADIPIRMYEGDLAKRLGLFTQAHAAYMAVLKEDPKNELAALKLKQLAAPGGAPAPGEPQPAPNFRAAAPGLASPAVLSFLNRPQVLSQMKPGELPPLATLPRPLTASITPEAVQPDHVSTLSGFLSQLRSYSISEKDRIAKAQDATQEALGLKASTPALSLPPLPPLPQISETPVIAAAGGTSAAPAAMPAAAGTTAAAGTAAAAAGTAAAPDINSLAGLALQALGNKGGASSLAAAAQAAPSLLSGGLKGMSSADLATALNMVKGPLADKLGIKLPEQPAAAQPAAGANQASTSPQTAPDIAQTKAIEGLQSAYHRIGTLEEQNRQLAAQLEQAQKAMNTMKQPDTQSAMQSTPQSAPQTSTSPTTQTPADNAAAAPPPDVLPDVSPDPVSSRTSLVRSNGALRFELEGVVPSRSDIKLKVVLRNDRDLPLELPQHIKAVIKMNGRPDRLVTVSFPAKQIAPHSESHGFIRVPGHDLNASADVYLSDFLPPTEHYRNLHLSVPISKV